MSKQKVLIIEANKRGYIVNKDGIVYGLNGNILKLSKTNKGYLSFNMRLNKLSNPTRIFVHRLQAYQKYKDELFNYGMVVRHLDGNSLNNRIDNIAIGTHHQNMMDKPTSIRNRLAEIGWKAANPRTEEERFEIYRLIEKGESYKSIQHKFAIGSSTLSYMKNRSKEYKKYIAR